jgi:hypothetical protein
MFLLQISILLLTTTKTFWAVNYYDKFMLMGFGFGWHVSC